MSNKTQLQSNNTKYASLIETLRGKAAGGSSEDLDAELTAQENLIAQLSTILDSKASGGSSGSVETYAGEINGYIITDVHGTLRYLDENLSLQTVSLGAIPYNFRPVKNSMFSIYVDEMYGGCSGATFVGNCMGERVFIADEDGFTITFSL